MKPDGEQPAGIAATLAELVALRHKLPHGRPGARMGPVPGTRLLRKQSRGMEFAESRPYLPGDDVRSMDWRQTARRGMPYTKLFQEEHGRPVQLLVDLGASMRFGTRVAFKSVCAARAAALLAWQAADAGERVGGIVSSGGAQHEVRVQSRHHGVLALLQQLAGASAHPAHLAHSDNRALTASLQALARTLRPGSLAVIVSDFDGLDAAQEGVIASLAMRDSVLLVQVYDCFESNPPPGMYCLSDGRRSMAIDLRPEAARAAYAAPFLARTQRLRALACRPRIRLVSLATHDDAASVLFGGVAGAGTS